MGGPGPGRGHFGPSRAAVIMSVCLGAPQVVCTHGDDVALCAALLCSVLRTLARRSLRQELRQLCKEERQRQEQAIRDVLAGAAVVCCTLTGVLHPNVEVRF